MKPDPEEPEPEPEEEPEPELGGDCVERRPKAGIASLGVLQAVGLRCVARGMPAEGRDCVARGMQAVGLRCVARGVPADSRDCVARGMQAIGAQCVGRGLPAEDLELCLRVECSPKQSKLLRATAPSLWVYPKYSSSFFYLRELISETEHRRCMQSSPDSFYSPTIDNTT